MLPRFALALMRPRSAATLPTGIANLLECIRKKLSFFFPLRGNFNDNFLFTNLWHFN